ncbi:MAG: RNA polymerase sigma factor [Clostridia bacterium]|nr:RNA polymerase sigma factor [Clostridia bacterium]
MDDQKIIELYFARAEQAIRETEIKYGGYCFLIAHNILSSREDAEECVNDTYLNAWNSIPPNKPNPLKTFLGRITRNLAINRYIKNHAKMRSGEADLILEEVCEFIPDPASATSLCDEYALKAAINSFLSSLPKKARIIFVRRYWYLTPISRIARELSLNENSVKVTLHRTRIAFKAHLEQEGIDL